MQTVAKILSISSLIFLVGCTHDVEDEKFGLIKGGFPKLVDVPDRPDAPDQEDLNDDKEDLMLERQAAYMDQQKNFEQLRK